MFDYIKGSLAELTPTYAVIDCGGVGYLIHISLHSYSKLSLEKTQTKDLSKLFIHQIIREDTNMLFGFAEKSERDVFRLLILVSGVGANTARMMLSSMSPTEIQSAIASGNVSQLKSIKGIGLKTAQRIIIDLKDKIGKVGEEDELFIQSNNTIREESLSALIMLGFAKTSAEKVIDKIISDKKGISVEELVKEALNKL